MRGPHHCLHDEGAVTLLVACSALKRAETEVRWCTEAVNGGYGATLYNLTILVILLITTCQLILQLLVLQKQAIILFGQAITLLFHGLHL